MTHANVNPRKLARSWTNRLGERITLRYHPAGTGPTYERVMVKFTPDPVLTRRETSPHLGHPSDLRSLAAKNAPSHWWSFDRRLVEQVVGAILSCEIPALACVLDLVRGGECRMVEVRDTPRRRRHFNRMSELVGNPKDPEDRLRVVKAGGR